MKIAAGLICLLALPLAAQDEVYRELELGDRIQITFRNGSTITGTLVLPPGDPRIPEEQQVKKIDYVEAAALTIDVKWEYPGSEGTVTIPKDQIKVIRELAKLDRATIEQLKKDRERIKAQVEKDEADRQAANAERAEAALKAAAEEAKQAEAAGEVERLQAEIDALKEGQDLLAQFPPGDWGEERIKKIQQKSVLGIRPTPEEVEFQLNYDKWKAALTRREEEEKKAEEKKKEEEENPEE